MRREETEIEVRPDHVELREAVHPQHHHAVGLLVLLASGGAGHVWDVDEDVGVYVSAVTGDTPSVQGHVVTAEHLLVPSHQDLLLKAVSVIIHPGDVLVVAGDLLPGQVEAVQHSPLQHQSVELRPQQSLLAGTALRLVKSE